MKNVRNVFLFFAICGVLATGYCFYQKKNVEAIAGLIEAVVACGGYILNDDKKQGKGGNAIAMEEGADLTVNNSDSGRIIGGNGGSGGNGGDAIQIRKGVSVTINNNGDILGGNAGQG